MGNKNSFWDTITSYMKFQIIAAIIILFVILVALIFKSISI
jgi:hypothetical protein